MAFNYYNIPLLSDAPTENKDFPYYCEHGKSPSIQFIVAAGQTVGTITLTNGTDTQAIPYTIVYENETTFRVVSLRQISFTPTITTGDLWIEIVVGSDTFYTPFIRFSDLDCLFKLEFYHHEPIVKLNGEYISYNNNYKSFAYLPKTPIEPIYSNQNTTDERDLVKFDAYKVIKKQGTFEAFMDQYLVDALQFVDGHSYVIFDGDNISEFEIEAEQYDNELYLVNITYRSEATISTNAGNGAAYSNYFDINPIIVPSFLPSNECEPVLISDIQARLLYSDTAPTVQLFKDDVAVNSPYVLSSSTLDSVQCKHALDTTPLVTGSIYHYEIDGEKSASFRAPEVGESLLKIKVSHDELIYNGTEGIHYGGLPYLEGIYKFYEQFQILTEVETDEIVNELDLVKFKYYTVKKKWYSAKIITHVSALDFLEFADLNDSVTITTPYETYNTNELEITDKDFQTNSTVVVSLRWNIGEVTRTRNGARSLSIHGDYNNDYNSDYNNF